MKRLLGILAVVGVLLAAFVPHGGPAQAQTPPASGDLQRRYDDAFQEMLRQPDNLEVLFSFATLAAQTGDLEGAISTLERMLLINPDLPRVRLELGVLYYRLDGELRRHDLRRRRDGEHGDDRRPDVRDQRHGDRLGQSQSYRERRVLFRRVG